MNPLTLHSLYPNPSSESRSEWTREEGIQPLSLERYFHLKNGRAFISQGLFSPSPGLPSYIYSSCNVPHLEHWVIALCGHVLSPLLDHKLIENRETVYRQGSNGKHCLLNTYSMVDMVLSTLHIMYNGSLQQSYEAGVIIFIQILWLMRLRSREIICIRCHI